MTPARELAHRLLSLRNLVPILVIVIAVIASLGIVPAGLQLKNEQVIMALLAFLAVDALVERLDVLTNIGRGVESIRRTASTRTTAAAFLKRRKQLPRMEQLMEEARNDIWVAGVTMDTIATLSTTFRQKASEGCQLRFLAAAPEGEALEFVAKYFGGHADFIAGRINSNLHALVSAIRSDGGGPVEIRVLDSVLTTGYFIIDPHRESGRMNVQLYLYRKWGEEAPVFTLSKADDADWFTVFLRQFEEAWSDARPYQPPRKSASP
jgi:hypothetical protein